MMQMKPDELRQLRAWAFDSVVGKYTVEMAHGKRDSMPPISQLITESKKLINYVRSSVGT